MFTGLAALTELLRRKLGTDDSLAVLLALPAVTSGFPNSLHSRQIVAARTSDSLKANKPHRSVMMKFKLILAWRDAGHARDGCS